MPNKYWVANSPALFDSSNWSTSSGGSPGASTPGSSDSAYFDDQGIGNCDLNNIVDVSNFNVASGYSGSITQNSYQIAISNDADFSGGGFIGGGAPITIGGNFYLTGTDFTNTDQTLTLGGSFHNSGFFHDSSGTFRVLMSNQDFYPNDATFNSLQLGIEQDTSASYLWVHGHCYVYKDLYLYHGVLRSASDGTIHVQGNISCDGGYGLWSPINNVPIALDGSGVQVLYADGGIISHLIINKSNSNQIIVRGPSNLNLNGDLIVNDGTFNLNNHDIIMQGSPV